jgi:gamma-glutamyltranspeptidase/glutathione hydrolase
MVAAGHPLTAQAGADVLADGGNAVDAALAAMLTSWATEPLLTGPGAGGYMLVAGGGEAPTLLDFFVAAPGLGRPDGTTGELTPLNVSFGDAHQVFYVGAASCGPYGCPAGIAQAHERWGSVPLRPRSMPAPGSPSTRSRATSPNCWRRSSTSRR